MWAVHLFFGSTNWILTSFVMSGIFMLHTIMYYANGDKKFYPKIITINDIAIFTAIWVVTLGLTYVKEA